MTDRLYYDDAYLWEFDGTVTAGKETDGPWIALDRSAFYPTSGGQPYDTGSFCFDGKEIRVTDVEADREGIVWHRVEETIPAGTSVHGKINSERRIDHMEQHGGEHMLPARSGKSSAEPPSGCISAPRTAALTSPCRRAEPI